MLFTAVDLEYAFWRAHQSAGPEISAAHVSEKACVSCSLRQENALFSGRKHTGGLRGLEWIGYEAKDATKPTVIL